MDFKACANKAIILFSKAKFFGTPLLKVIVLPLTWISLAEPEVRKVWVIGTCVESPRMFSAVAPHGRIRALSLRAIASAIFVTEG